MKQINFQKKLIAIAAILLTASAATVTAHASELKVGLDQVTITLNEDNSVKSAVTKNDAGIFVCNPETFKLEEKESLDKTAKVIQSGNSYTVPVFVRLNGDHTAVTDVEFGIEISDLAYDDAAVSYEVFNIASDSGSKGGEALDWGMTFAVNDDSKSTWLVNSFSSPQSNGTCLALFMVTIDNPTLDVQYPVIYKTEGINADGKPSVEVWKNGKTSISPIISDGYIEFHQETTPETTTTTTTTTIEESTTTTTTTTVETTTEETTVSPTALNAYRDILDMYYENISNNWEGFSNGTYGIRGLTLDNVSYMWQAYFKNKTLSETGYQFIDLNHDGLEELLVSVIDIPEKGYSDMICDVYTIDGEDVVHLASSGERDAFFLGENGELCEQSSGSVNVSGNDYYLIRNGALICQESYLYDAYENEEHPYFYAELPDASCYDEYGNILASKMDSITEEEFYQGIAEHVHQSLQLTLFSEYQKSPKIKAGDADSNGDINILDVILVNRAILGKSSLTAEQVKAVDFNGNGYPEPEEALMIMKYIVGIITDFS